MNNRVAVVGMACRYPDARSPVELWENALAGRRAFRRIPEERLRVEDYYSTDPLALDSIYSTEAGLIHDYEFDRVKYRVAGTTYRGADHAHWLALDVAAQALEDAGFQDGEGLPKATTGVLVGNTLTGEFSRANTLRLRWPYVRRVVESVLLDFGWPAETLAEFIRSYEDRFKEPFAPMDEETLAGNLSNTIAGRICNHFDLKGAGYTVDAACASSLLAIATACSALIAGDLDAAVAGGVDLSIDPFELVGFARAGALARGPMLVYDERSSGFLPGEGCGFVVLMRHRDAVAQRRRIHAVIRGWGVSSDGAGGMTRPERGGQLLALQRAYDRAGFSIGSVAYFEGHGTGTSVGDATELKTLSDARRLAGANYPAAIGSIKANIGHTKAAAGVAGAIKAIMAAQNQIIPPTTGCELPQAELKGATAALRVPRKGERWPGQGPIRAGVSAMGFGGINTHVVLEVTAPRRRSPLTARERAMLSSPQDAELFLMSAHTCEDLVHLAGHLLSFARRLSYAELGDLAARLAQDIAGHPAPTFRAAIVASTPAEFESRLQTLVFRLEQGARRELDEDKGIFIGTGSRALIGFLFPGQASPVYVEGGAFARRFALVKDIYSRADLPVASDPSATELAQPAIITASISALRLLEQCGIQAELAIGHSVGEIAALHWAGAMDEDAAIRIASARGRVMADVRGVDGKMASVRARRHDVESMLKGSSLVVACINSSDQTVVSGSAWEVDEFVGLARHKGWSPVVLPVSHAFHSPHLAPAVSAFDARLSCEGLRALKRKVISTVTGAELAPAQDLRRLLEDQIVSPVLFADALSHARPAVDLFIEVGPGSVLSGIASDSINTPVISIDAGGASLKGMLNAVGAAYVLGTPVNTEPLFGDRFNRPFEVDWNPRFFANPCEMAPVRDNGDRPDAAMGVEPVCHIDGDECLALTDPRQDAAAPCNTRAGILELVRGLVAQRTDLPSGAIHESYRLLGDLHLNSITVSQIVAEAARRLALAPPVAPTDYSAVSIADVAAALDDLRLNGRPGAPVRKAPSGVDSWVRCFKVDRIEKPLRERRRLVTGTGKWRLIAPPGSRLGEALRERLGEANGEGVAVVLDGGPDKSYLSLLLEGAQAVLSDKNASHFLLVQHSTFGAAFVRTLHMEAPWINCCVATVPPGHPDAAQWILTELAAVTGFTEAEYDSSGARRIPALRLLQPTDTRSGTTLGSTDVILVSGGGKGIAAECALALARQTGARLAILGRSIPEYDAELAANIHRLASHGVEFRYYGGDVTDPEAVRETIGKVRLELGAITAIIHGAGVNRPKLIESITETDCHETIQPKVAGAQNLLACIDPVDLRLFVTFGSLIARTGMRGEGHYALANELLRDLTEKWQVDHQQCRVLCIEWSVWAGPGMGQRLGALDTLLHEGVTPVSLDQGIAMLSRLVFDGSPQGSVVVSGRFGEPPTVTVQRPELPFRRFLEHPRTYYPGVELVVEAEISSANDPYVEDHVFQGDALFPAVMGLEAMAQTAMALAETDDPPTFEDIQFNRAIVVPDAGVRRISISALMHEDRAVEVVIRSEDTEYQVNHFRAVCRFETVTAPADPAADGSDARWGSREKSGFVDLDPKRDLYGGLLFHSGRFVRVRGYFKISATECIAEIGSGESSWFGAYLPRSLVLGCPGRRDAVIHAIQVCVPDAVLLPVGADRLRLYRIDEQGPCRVIARERERSDDVFVYDVEVVDADGALLETWEGLKLRRVMPRPPGGCWPLPLVAPYVERVVADTAGASPVSVVLLKGSDRERRVRSDSAIQLALGQNGLLVRRLDGKPEVVGERSVSASHCGEVTMAVSGPSLVACDLESVTERDSAIWKGLLGDEGLKLAQVVSRLAGDDANTAATRVWTALECLRKCGAPMDAALTFSCEREGCVVLSTGGLSIITVSVMVGESVGRVVLAVLAESNLVPGSATHSALEYEGARA